MFSAGVLSQAVPPAVTLGRNYEQAVGASERPSFLRLTKLRSTTFVEYDVQYPCDTDGIYWHRVLNTNRFTPAVNSGKLGNGGAFIASSMLSILAASVTQNENTQNETTGTLATTVTDNIIRTDVEVTTSGTWTSPTTTSGVASITYPNPQNAGASCTLRFTVASGNQSRVVVEALRNTNGGTGRVRLYSVVVGTPDVLTDVTETYCVCKTQNGHRAIDFNAPDSGAGRTIYPLVEGLPDGTYDLKIDEHPDNAASRRVQIGTFKLMPDRVFNTVSVDGTGTSRTIASTSCTSLFPAGARSGFTLTNCTMAVLNYVQNTTGGIVEIEVFDSTGTPVTPDVSQIDTNGAAQAKSAILFSGLTKGTYHVQLKVADTTTGSRWLYYDNGIVSIDETTAGTPGVDAFIFPGYPSSMANSLDMGKSGVFQGNLESALEVYDPAESSSTALFTTSIHGCETAPEYTFKVDGVVIDYDAAATGDDWDATISIEVTQVCDVYYPTDVQESTVEVPTDGFAPGATPFATRTYVYTYRPTGVWVSVNTVILKNVRVLCDFALMFQVMNGNTSSPAYKGGLDEFARSEGASLTLDSYAGGALTVGTTQDQVWAAANSDLAAIGRLLNREQIIEAFSDFTIDSTRLSEWRSNVNTNKSYTNAFRRITSGEGLLLEPGFEWTCRQHFDVAIGDYRSALGLI